MIAPPPSSTCDVAIVGAGPAGLALAVALAQAGIASTVLERQGLHALAHPAEDGRDIALTHRARAILEALGLWQRLPAHEIAPLQRAEVRDGVSPLVLPFDASAQGHDALGWLVPNHRLREAAFAAADELPMVQLHADAAVVAFERSAGAATLTLENGHRISAALVVAADSRFSALRRMAGIGAQLLDFGRSAIVARIAHEHPHQGIAHECFRYGNTLAMLPMAGRQVSAVVTLPGDEAPEWMALSDADFAARVQQQFGDALGLLRPAGPRHVYPLVATYAHRFAGPRLALLGDTAVGMHPVTAHGYNFGLYGVQVLASELQRARRQRRPDAEALSAYERSHRRATLPVWLGTNAIVRLFTDDRAPARVLRRAVLQVARQLPPLRSAIARQLTGSGPAAYTSSHSLRT